MYKLTAISGTIVAGTEKLTEGENIVGRSRACAVRVTAADVSGKHCKIIVAGQAIAVENLSQNGTLLDGQPIEYRMLIQPGQVLQLMAGVTLRLDRDAAATPAEASTQDPAATTLAPPLADSAATDEAETAEETRAMDPTRLHAALKPKGGPVPAADQEASTVAPLPPFPAPGGAPFPEAPPTGDHGLATGIGDFDPPAQLVPSYTPPTAEALSPGHPSTSEAGNTGTRFLETRMIRPEDLEALRAMERAKPRKRMIMLAAAGLGLLLVVFLLWPKAPPPETTILWPLDKDGSSLDHTLSEGMGGFKEGGYLIYFPGGADWTREATTNGYAISTHIGRDFDVPYLLTLEEKEDDRFVQMTLQQVARDWMEVQLSDGGWNFDTLSSVQFFGIENGIPYLSVSYGVTKNGEWYGTARITQVGTRRIVLRTDVPFSERARALDHILQEPCLVPSIPLIRRHWAGDTEQTTLEARPLLERLRTDLDRVAPATWSALTGNLKRACRKAYMTGDADSLKEAEAMLTQLRNKQVTWFNAQKIAREEALSRGNYERMQRIAELCKGVFATMDDLRYFVVRGEDW